MLKQQHGSRLACLVLCDCGRSLRRWYQQRVHACGSVRFVAALPIEEVGRALHQWIDEARVFIPGSPAHRDIMCAVTTWLELHLARLPRPKPDAKRLREMIVHEQR